MTLKEYLDQKPIEDCFDLIPSVYKGRDLHEYENVEIKTVKTDQKILIERSYCWRINENHFGYTT